MNEARKWYLSGQDNQESAEEIQALLIVTLHHSNGANGVGVAAAGGDPTIRHDRDNHVLLDVERARVEAERPPPEQLILLHRQRRRHEPAERQHRYLHKYGGDGERLRPVYEEGVEKHQDHARGHAQHPCTECHDREGGVVGLRHHQRHLLDGASLRRRLLPVGGGGLGGCGGVSHH